MSATETALAITCVQEHSNLSTVCNMDVFVMSVQYVMYMISTK